ncbi:probable pectate lyase [Fusarium fujikuroi]|nr:probable pectate lyase [Fusarium fujikuroi]
MFILEDGATLRNVIIGPGQTEGLDYAITLKQKSGTSTICGGGAFHATDKQGKLVRSCGNCKDNYGPRNVVTDNVAAVNGGVLCGINTNYGDTGTISNACQDSGKNCDLFDNFDYTLKGFNSLTAFPSSHPVFSNFMKDVQINEAQEAIDPVAEFPFEDSFKSATNIKSREKVPS